MPSEPAVRDFAVPDLGEGLEEATIVEWHVAPGDRVELNQDLCSVETAKAVVEVPAPYAGVVVERHGEVGETIEVGSLLVRIDTGAAAGTAAPPEQPAGAEAAGAAPARRAVLVGYGVDADQDRSRRHGVGRAAAPAGSRHAAPVGRGGLPLAKPPVRLLARRLGVDLRALAPGTGPDGIVTRQDVLAAAGTADPQAASDGAAAGGVRGEVEVRPVHAIRARIAERMTRSRASIPDAHGLVEVDCSRLLELRATLQQDRSLGDDAATITPFSLFCRVLVLVLRRHPLLNASFDEEQPAIRVHHSVHLGVAAATERGVLVPVIHEAQDLDLPALSRQITDLAEGARAGTLPPERLQGSTITVSNFGMFGFDEGVPVINPPEAAILGLGGIKPRPFVVDGELAVRPTLRVTCAFDHRVCDGAEVGAFLTDLQNLLERPDLALLHA